MPSSFALLLETNRLIIRPFTAGDLATFIAYRNDPQVAVYQGWSLPYTQAMADEFLEEMRVSNPLEDTHWRQLVLEIKASGEMIGDVAFHRLSADPRQAEIGITLASRYQGKGYAGEAVSALLDYLFGELKLHRVMATTDVENTRAIRGLDRFGFRREAHFVENYPTENGYTSEYVYAMLDREWIGANP